MDINVTDYELLWYYINNKYDATATAAHLVHHSLVLPTGVDINQELFDIFVEIYHKTPTNVIGNIYKYKMSVDEMSES